MISARDLGWKELARQLLAESPELVNRRSGAGQVTPLREAAARRDVELARLGLAAGPDLELQDSQYQSTPLGWARHFGRTEIAKLIEQHRAQAS